MYIAKARGKNQVQVYGANRRAHRRIDAVVDGEYRVFEKEIGSFSTLDISERSLRVTMSREVSESALLEFTLMLPEHGQKVSAVGRVLRSEQLEGGDYQLAINIVDISGRAHLTLKRYLRDQDPDPTPPNEP